MAVDPQVIAILTGAIIISRNVKTVAEIQEAWKDATYVVAPKPKSADYETWQVTNEVKPTVPSPDFRTESSARRPASSVELRLPVTVGARRVIRPRLLIDAIFRSAETRPTRAPGTRLAMS
jgi:hypothetical protein